MKSQKSFYRKSKRQNFSALVSGPEYLDTIADAADENANLVLAMMVQILREIREIKELLKQKYDASNSGNDCSNGAHDRKRLEQLAQDKFTAAFQGAKITP